jgi:voltage-gated potassium channel
MSRRQQTPLQKTFYEVIFGTETPAGKWFDILLIITILASVAVIMLDSIHRLDAEYGFFYLKLEWGFTVLFSVEYLIRIWCSPNRKGYVLSLYGVIDLLSLLPTYLSLLVPQTAPLLIIRLLRILRIFRVLRLLRLLQEANFLAGALRRSARKIFVFFAFMMILATIFGCLVYVAENGQSGFENIPVSIYWAIVTVTTVGYGDVVPQSVIGRVIASIGMLIGYAVIAVPTGIVTAELTLAQREQRDDELRDSRNCTNCSSVELDPEAHYCRFCASPLPKPGHALE